MYRTVKREAPNEIEKRDLMRFAIPPLLLLTAVEDDDELMIWCRLSGNLGSEDEHRERSWKWKEMKTKNRG